MCHQHCLMSEWIRPSKLRESGSFYSKSFKRINLIVLGPHILYEECQDGINDRWFLFNINNTQPLRSIWSNVSSKLLQGFWINTNENSFWKSRFKCAWHLIYNICRDLKKLNFFVCDRIPDEGIFFASLCGNRMLESERTSSMHQRRSLW